MTSYFRLDPQVPLMLDRDWITVDLYAGGGGASTGMEAFLGHSVDIAINHDPGAISMHMVNHPHTEHLCENILEVDPLVVVKGRRLKYLWLSPDCTHHSKARGTQNQITAVHLSRYFGNSVGSDARELFALQGFPDDYVIDVDHEGNSVNATVAVGRCGNSVVPLMPELLLRANNPQVERLAA